MNKVIEVLKGLVENAERENLMYKGKVYRLSDPGLPPKAGAAVVRSRLDALLENAPDEE